jgi:hypothetical protein
VNIDDRLRDATAAVDELVTVELDIDADLRQVMRKLAVQPVSQQRHRAATRARAGMLGLVRNPLRSLPLAKRIAAIGLRLLPAADRQRYADEWAGDLESAAKRLPLAVRLMVRTPRLALVLWFHVRRQSPGSARRFDLRKGLIGAVATAIAAATGILVASTPPTWLQIGLVVLVAVLAGLTLGWPAGRHASDEQEEPERKKVQG